ncbi:hypothetical protein GJAV_G00132700 [Gymnothorax javanicus]|nr:hypothetical protein GJAV_G00132700 [Gymnothorax javanicus]
MLRQWFSAAFQLKDRAWAESDYLEIEDLQLKNELEKLPGSGKTSTVERLTFGLTETALCTDIPGEASTQAFGVRVGRLVKSLRSLHLWGEKDMEEYER